MKNKLFWFILVLLIIAIIFSIIKGPEEEKVDFNPLNVNVGDEFKILNYDNNTFVLNYNMKDVTGDGFNDLIMVVGKKEKVDDLSKSDLRDFQSPDKNSEAKRNFRKVNVGMIESKGPSNDDRKVNNIITKEVIQTSSYKDRRTYNTKNSCHPSCSCVWKCM